MALNPNVVVVAPGELITAVHLNNIRSNLDRIDVLATGKVAKTGDTMNGTLYQVRDPATGSGAEIRLDGGIRASVTAAGGSGLNTPNLQFGRGAAAAGVGAVFVSFRVDPSTNLTPMTTQIGSITQATASTVAYNTTSDPRLKQVTGDAADALELVAALGATAFRGRWLDPSTREVEEGGEEWIMLSSHDIEDVAPFAVSGDRDAVDDDGRVVPQQVNYPALVPLLAAALAQALARIKALEGGTP